MRVHRFVGGLATAALVLASTAFIAPAHAAPPSNDNFAGAVPIAGAQVELTGANADATSESGESALVGSRQHSVWYSWTAPASGEYAISTAGSNFDTWVGVYTGSSIAGAAEVGHGDDGLGLQTFFTFDAVAGTNYHVGVLSYGSVGGSFRLWLGHPSDTTAPAFAGAVVNPDVLTGAAPVKASVSIALTDNVGVFGAAGSLCSPTWDASVSPNPGVCADEVAAPGATTSAGWNFVRTSGTPQSGVWTATFTLPANAALGAWKLVGLELWDRTNDKWYDPWDTPASPFPGYAAKGAPALAYVTNVNLPALPPPSISGKVKGKATPKKLKAARKVKVGNTLIASAAPAGAVANGWTWTLTQRVKVTVKVKKGKKTKKVKRMITKVSVVSHSTSLKLKKPWVKGKLVLTVNYTAPGGAYVTKTVNIGTVKKK